MSARSEINVTPLIDIVLVLLIIFIVLVPSLVKVQAIMVPRVVEGPAERSPQIPLMLSLDGQGRIFLQAEEIRLHEVAERLAAPLLLQPLNHRKVFVKVDGELPQQSAVRLLDEVRRASELAKARSLGMGRPAGEDARVVVSLRKT